MVIKNILDNELEEIKDIINQYEENITRISLTEIDSFPNHPYKVINDEKMQEMTESIKQYGVTQPVIVRKKSNGRYEMISGHRRKRASELAGKKDIIAIIKDLTDEEATILMVDSNENQREECLFSEKAFAFKMKLEAIKKQAGRPKNNSVPVAQNLKGKTSREIVAEGTGESQDQIRRYIRLTELIPEILEMVDEKIIAFRPAVELSYLSKENQKDLYEIMDYLKVTPSLAQAIKLKKLEQDGELNADVIDDIIGEEKPNQVEKIKLDASRFEKVFPKNIVSNKDKEDFIFMCIEEHNKRIKNRELNR